MTFSPFKMRLRARTLHRLANFHPTMSPNMLGLMRNTATMLQAAYQKIEHLEKRVSDQDEVSRAALFRAWQEGHNHCFHVEDPNNHDRNPYAPEK